MAFGFPIQQRKVFVVTCNRCRREVPAGVTAFPFESVVVTCPLCGKQLRYLPSEVYLGIPNALVGKGTKGQH
jgi:rRNA maturation endonuclease Nob1